MIDQAVRDQSVMLAQASKNVDADVHAALELMSRDPEYVYDLKWDGVRCLAYVDMGNVQLINRRGVDITFRYPEIIGTLGVQFSNERIVLDGEIVCLGEDGLPDFARVHRRDAQQSATAIPRLMQEAPATYMAFDILYYQGDDLRGRPYVTRRALLGSLGSTWGTLDTLPAKSHLAVSTSSEDGKAMWTYILDKGLEGLIAKRKSSHYRAGRNSAWTKLKPTRTITAMVSGVDKGKGWRADSFGALHLSLVGADSTLVQIGKVGTGFKQADLDLVQERIATGQPLIIEVGFQDVSPDRKLRFPVFKGIRDDMTVMDCTEDQLDLPKHEWQTG